MLAFVLIILNVLVWYPVLSFWFFRGWEQSWLIGICGYNFDLLCLIRSHGILYLLNYKLFGWNPVGWYLTAVILHITSVLLTYVLVKRLTKNTLLSFTVALIFGVNVVHNDVVNWGSFEGLYALMMVSFLLAVITYINFREDKRNTRYIWYATTVVLFLFGLFVRESALVVPFFLLFTELFLKGFRITKRFLIQLLVIFFPFLIISGLYLVFRQWYGGAPHDFIDGMVQLRIALLKQGMYAEYLWRGILSFGKFAGAHVIPYPISNFTRDIVGLYLHKEFVNYYFFPFTGVLYVSLQLVILFLMRKDKKVRNLLLFAFLWFLIPTVFFSFAFSITDEYLMRPYEWNSSRWRYFAFFGTAVYWVALLWKAYEVFGKRYSTNKVLIQRLTIGIVIAVVAVNWYFLRVIQDDMYKTAFKPEKDFFKAFTQFFPSLPQNYTFYSFPYASTLNDYLSEWYYLRRVYHPNLKEERIDWVESHLGMLLERYQERTAKLNETFFLDYNPNDGLLNKTDEVRAIISNQKEYLYPISKTGDSVDIALNPKLHVEIPYKVEVSLSAIPSEDEADWKKHSPQDQAALEAYTLDRVVYLRDVKVTVCKTAPLGSQGHGAMHFSPNHLIDGNFGQRSFWTADCRPAGIILDLGTIRSIGAIAFRSNPGGPNIPADYTISVSNDAKTWQDTLTMRKNTLYQKIDTLPKPQEARYVKFTVDQTNQGAMLMLDELEVISEEALPVVKMYQNDFEKLVFDSYNYGTFMRFSWNTDPNNFDPSSLAFNNSMYIPYIADGQERTYVIEPNEGEFYSAQGQFLKRFITHLMFDFVGDKTHVEVSHVRIVPRFKH